MKMLEVVMEIVMKWLGNLAENLAINFMRSLQHLKLF
jgi:hypothetical protein